jgi:hypothetical protein
MVDKNMSEMKQMIEQALKGAPQQTVYNITNNLYQHISITDIGGFKSLCDRMGIPEATEFLCKMAAKPQLMDLFEKVYLDCDPAHYPIAHNNGRDFYYRDAENKLIIDEGGSKIAQLSERLMKNTFIEAADPLLAKFVRQNDGDKEGDDVDYDRFRELQNGACRVKVDKSFIKELYPRTYNPNHTFFCE